MTPRRKMPEHLTAEDVSAIRTPGRHPIAPHLWLSIATNGARSWFYRYDFDGKSRSLWLGPCSRVTLEDALARVAFLRLQCDPVGQLQRQREVERGLILVSVPQPCHPFASGYTKGEGNRQCRSQFWDD
jgi:Arm DNA-binding domain